MAHTGPQPTAPIPTVIGVIPDLLSSTRVEDMVQACGGRSHMLGQAHGLADAVDRLFPVLVLIDLAAEGDWEQEIRRVKLRPATRQTPIVAFGGHVDTDALSRARGAGADHVWARSRLAADLVALVQRHVTPPVRYPAGWDDELPDKARMGVEEFNRGNYFEQHEFFEDAWNEEPRPVREMYQGILQVGVAFMQVQAGNRAGALKLFRRGLPRLRDLPPICQGIDLAAFRAAAEAIHAHTTALDTESLSRLDEAAFPRLTYDPDWRPPAKAR